MFSIDGTNIKLTRGDTFKATVSILQSDGTAYVPDNDDVIVFAVKRSFRDSDAVITKTLDNSTLLLELAPADTKDLPFGQYVYDIQLTYANTDVDTFIQGKLTLTEEVA